jgi:2-isopropylmalate synthase|tara:strand:- start:342 stop:1493 length:1152 start_codon:yes stop_codon:yes gene_type:complete
MKIFETTLRDGEQAAIIHLQPDQKAVIASDLEAMGCDIIDAGFPIASRPDWEGARAVAEATRTCRLSVLARQIEKDIDSAASALEGHLERARVSTWVMPYEIYTRHKGDPETPGKVLDLTRRAVAYARNVFPEVQYYMVYSGNRDPGFLCEVAAVAADTGAACIVVADSQSVMTPEVCADLVRRVKAVLPDDVDLSVHAHNLMGLALANTVAAVTAGATQVEATIGGMGDAGGNVALEQVLGYASFLGKDDLRFANNCRLEALYAIASHVTELTGFQFGSNQAYVGPQTFMVETGIHQSLAEKIESSTLAPERIGRRLTHLVGRHSGVAGVRKKLHELGVDMSDVNTQELYALVMKVTERSGMISDEDLLRLVSGAPAPNHPE